jgi:hypothetical protein
VNASKRPRVVIAGAGFDDLDINEVRVVLIEAVRARE